jgi:hypothetical protein
LDAWTAVVLELNVGAGWCTTMGVMLRKDLNPTWYRRYGLVKSDGTDGLDTDFGDDLPSISKENGLLPVSLDVAESARPISTF